MSASEAQPITQALDLGGAYRVLDLMLSIYSLTGSSPSVTVDVYTSMQNDNNSAWALLGSFSEESQGDRYELKTFTGALRYVRYNVTLGGSSPEVIFDITGYARAAS